MPKVQPGDAQIMGKINGGPEAPTQHPRPSKAQVGQPQACTLQGGPLQGPPPSASHQPGPAPPPQALEHRRRQLPHAPGGRQWGWWEMTVERMGLEFGAGIGLYFATLKW